MYGRGRRGQSVPRTLEGAETARVSPAFPARVARVVGRTQQVSRSPAPQGGGVLFINTQPALVAVDPMFPNNPDPFLARLIDLVS